MKDKLLALISAHPGKSTLAGLVLAFLALAACGAVATLLSAPSRLHKGQEVVLLKGRDMDEGDVCIVAENPREALFVGAWTGGTVLADEGSVWAVDRGIDVRLRGPEVTGFGYWDGERYWATLGPDRLVVRAGRSEVVPLEEAVARRRAAD